MRRLGVAFILLWSLLPLYWALNTSLQTDAQVGAKPAHYVPPSPTLGNYNTLFGGADELNQHNEHSVLRRNVAGEPFPPLHGTGARSVVSARHHSSRR